MNNYLTLLILAGGMGSRFGGLKQIEPMGPNGEFLIDYSIYDAKRAGFNKIVFLIKEENYEIFKETIGSRIEQSQANLDENDPNRITIEYCFQKNDNVPNGIVIPKDRMKPLGTAHAIYCCKDVIKEKFAIISADDFYGYDAFEKAANFLKTNDDFCVVGYKVGETLSDKGSVKRGICMEENGYLTKVIESKVYRENDNVVCEPLSGQESFSVSLSHPVSMLMFGFTPIIFDNIEKQMIDYFNSGVDLETAEHLIPDVLDKMISNNQVNIKVLNTVAKWFGVTYREDLEFVREILNDMIDKGVYPNDLWNSKIKSK